MSKRDREGRWQDDGRHGRDEHHDGRGGRHDRDDDRGGGTQDGGGPANRVIGTDGDDTITAGGFPGPGGDDLGEASPGVRGVPSFSQPNAIFGRGGDDSIIGGIGSDRISGGRGDDRLLGVGVLSGVVAEDTLIGGKGDDFLLGGPYTDHLRGGGGADTLIAGDLEFEGGADRLWGGSGNDLLDGSKGADTLHGGTGEDVFRFALGITGPAPSSTTRPGEGNRDVILDFHQGEDLIDLSTWQTFFRPPRDNPENSFLGTGAFRGFEDLEVRYEIRGDITVVQIRSATNGTWNIPTEGEIELRGRIALTAADFDLGRRDDAGQPGDGGQPVEDPPVPPGDTPGAILGTEGDDSLTGTVAGDLILGRAGDDTLSSGGFLRSPADTIFGEEGADSITGDLTSDDRLFGGPGDDTLYGGDFPFQNGRDSLSGGEGDDVLLGSPGDTLAGGAGDDVFRFTTGQAGGNFFPATPAGVDTRNVILDFEQGKDVIELGFRLPDPEAAFLGTGAFTARPDEPPQIRYEFRGDTTLVQILEPFETAPGLGVIRPDIRQEIELKGHIALTVDDFAIRLPADGGGPGDGGDPGEEPAVPPAGTPGVTFGTPGNDNLVGIGTIFGFEGDDNISAPFLSAESVTFVGGAGNDGLSGYRGNDRLYGGDGDDGLRAGEREFGGGDDLLSGGKGDDTLEGSRGADTMIGGSGEDVFLFSLAINSSAPASTTGRPANTRPDLILDFEQGKDVIDLSEWQTFFRPPRDNPENSFLGTGAFSQGQPDDLQVRYEILGDSTLVQIRSALNQTWPGSTRGEIELKGHHALTAADFVLGKRGEPGQPGDGGGPDDGGHPGDGGQPGAQIPLPQDDTPVTIPGTEGDDSLVGTFRDDVILGGGGEDTLYAGDFPFTTARDFLSGGAGDDELRGFRGDTLEGGAGEDSFRFITGFADGFFPSTPAGRNSRNLILDFEQGSDVIDLGFGVASCPAEVFLGTGDFTAREGRQIRYEIEGDSTFVEIFEPVQFPERFGGVVRPDIFQEIELKGRFELTAADFGLVPADGGEDGCCAGPPPPRPDNVGLGGSDLIIGGEDRDRLQGNRTIFYPEDPDLADTLIGGGGIDFIYGNPHADIIDGGAGNDFLVGSELYDFRDVVVGGDSISGGAGDDVIDDGRGTDTLEGGEGNDRFIFDLGSNDLNSRTGPPPIPSTRPGEGVRDVILDFEQGSDRIELEFGWQRVLLLPFSDTRPEPDAVFLGTDPFDDRPVLQVRYDIQGDVTVVQIRSATNAIWTEPAEGEIELRGHYVLTASDFLLTP